VDLLNFIQTYNMGVSLREVNRAGAQLVGDCYGTSPERIRALSLGCAERMDISREMI